MKIFARTVIPARMNGMVTRFARSASMTHAREGDNGLYASGARRLITSILSYQSYPLFKRLKASYRQALGSDRRFQ